MANIGLVDVDGKNYPNLALMKLSAYHKSKGDNVEWAMPLFGSYDRVYMSKVFSFSPDDNTAYDCEIVKGGTGYAISLNNGIEHYNKHKDPPSHLRLNTSIQTTQSILSTPKIRLMATLQEVVREVADSAM